MPRPQAAAEARSRATQRTPTLWRASALARGVKRGSLKIKVKIMMRPPAGQGSGCSAGVRHGLVRHCAQNPLVLRAQHADAGWLNMPCLDAPNPGAKLSCFGAWALTSTSVLQPGHAAKRSAKTLAPPCCQSPDEKPPAGMVGAPAIAAARATRDRRPAPCRPNPAPGARAWPPGTRHADARSLAGQAHALVASS